MLCIPFTTYRFSFGTLGSFGFAIPYDDKWADARVGDVVDLPDIGRRVVVVDILRGFIRGGFIWVRAL